MSVVGDKGRFAVEYDVNPDPGGVWLFGRMCFWIFGRQIGQFSLGLSLRDALFELEHLLRDGGRRRNPRLFGLSARQIADVLDDALYLGQNAEYESVATDEQWARNNVTMSLDVFSGWKLFLIEQGDVARLVVLRSNQEVEEFQLNEGEFDSVIALAREALDQLYETERRNESTT